MPQLFLTFLFLISSLEPYMIWSYNFPKYAWGDKGGTDYYITTPLGKYLNIVPGLTGQNFTVSFRDPQSPSMYLRHFNYLLYIEDGTNAQNHIFATFFVRQNHFFDGYESYESVNYPNYFIRHSYYRLKISEDDGSVLFKSDASFRPVP